MAIFIAVAILGAGWRCSPLVAKHCPFIFHRSLQVYKAETSDTNRFHQEESENEKFWGISKSIRGMLLKVFNPVVLYFKCVPLASHYYHKQLLVVSLLRNGNKDKGEKNNLTDKDSLEIWQMLTFSLLSVGGVQMLPEHLKIFHLPGCDLSPSSLPY